MRNPRVDVGKIQSQGYFPFFIASQNGHLDVVSLLLADPRIEPDKPAYDGATPVFIACQKGHQDVVSLLLADSRIDPDRPKNTGAAPFVIACQEGHREVVSLLLADPRIDANKLGSDGATPLWIASQNGHLVVVQHLLASGREIETRTRSTFNNRTAAEQGRREVQRGPKGADENHNRMKTNGPRCADLIDDYERDPVAVRHRLRRQPGLREHFIGHLFALVVFHSNSFVVINDDWPTLTLGDSSRSPPGFPLTSRWCCATGSSAHQKT